MSLVLRMLTVRVGIRLVVLALCCTFSVQIAEAQDAWMPIGPDGGEIRALAVDPESPEIVYAGTYEGGVFRSLDGGATWTAVNVGLTYPFVTMLAIDPDVPSTIYAGTGLGLFRSTTRGDTWTAVDGVPKLWVRNVVFDPAVPEGVVAATSNGGGVFRSDDGGLTWEPLNEGLPPLQVSALTIDPKTSTLYAGLQGAGVFRKLPGQDWEPFNNGGFGFATASVWELVFEGGASPEEPWVLYALTYDRMYRRYAVEPVWVPLNAGGPTPIVSLAAAPGSNSTVYAGGIGAVYRSSDAGVSWNALSDAFPTVELNALAIAPSLPTTMYVSTHEYGVFKSANGGSTWSSVSGVRAHEAVALAMDPITPTRLYVGASYGRYRSDDSGASWQLLSDSSAAILVVDPQMPSIVYAAELGVSRSLDNGATWTDLTLDEHVTAMAIDPQTPSTVFAGTANAGVFRSNDRGVTWMAVNTGLTFLAVGALAVNPDAPATVYVGTQGVGVFRSVDGGNTWALANSGLANRNIRALAVDPHTPTVIYAGTAAGVFVSVNAGDTWSSASNGLSLTTLDVRTLAVDPNVSGTVYVGIDRSGVFRSRDGGQSWTSISDGLSEVQLNVRALAIHPQWSAVAYLAASGSSVLQRIEAPVATTVEPAILPRGHTSVVTITGSNFVAGQMTIAPIAGVTVLALDVIDRTRIIATLSVSGGAALGDRNLRIDAPYASSATLAVGVTNPFPDLQITSTSSPPFAEGFDVTQTLTIANVGTASSDPPTVTATLPTGMTFVSASAGWACTPALQVVTCMHTGPLGVSASVTLAVTLAVHSGTGGSPVFSVSSAEDRNENNDVVSVGGLVFAAPVPRLELAPAPLQPFQQALVSVTLATPFPYDVSGTLSLDFAPDALIPGDDPAIQFASGGRQVAFVIEANTLSARFAGSSQAGPTGFQTGTVAGTFTMTGALDAGRVQTAFWPALPPGDLTLPRQPPRIHHIETRDAGGFAAYVLMSSTMREVTSISLEFQTSSRVQLSCGGVPGCSVDGSAVTLDVRALFADWFANNTALGSLGLLRLPLGVDSSLQGTVTVRVRNSLGASNAQVFPLP